MVEEGGVGYGVVWVEFIMMVMYDMFINTL